MRSFSVSVSADSLLPVNQTAPTFAGASNVGRTLTVVPGSWSGADTVVGQWCRDGIAIPGETGSRYLLAAEDDLTQISYHETATNPAGVNCAASISVLVLYEAPVATGDLFDEVFDQNTGVQAVDVSSDFAGGGLTFSVTGAGMRIDPASGVLSVDTADPVNGEIITVIATNSGGSAQTQFLLTVESVEEADQVLAFSGDDGLSQPITGFSNGALDAAGVWMAGYVFFDGATWAGGTILGLGDASAGYRRFALRTDGVLAANDSAVTTPLMPNPTTPGWYLCVSHIAYASLNRANLKFWRNLEYQEAPNVIVKTDASTFDTIGVGVAPGATPASYLSLPACGCAWGYGDPTLLHGWAYNGGLHRDLLEYDFAAEPGLTLEGYWAGARVDDGSAFTPMQIQDEIGSLDTWTQLGAPTWLARPPAWSASGIADIRSVAIEDSARNQAVVVAILPIGAFLAMPAIRHAEEDFDLWSTRGFGPIRILSAASVVAGNQITVTLTLNRKIHAGEPLFFTTGTNWLNDGVNVGAMETGAVANNSTLPTPAVASGLSFGKIAVAFDQAYVVGFYQDGLGYVIDPGGGVQITDVYPSPTVALDERRPELGLLDVHGGMKNPRYSVYEHGYDGRNYSTTFPTLKYQDAQNDAKTLPVSLSIHDSFIKVRSNLMNGSENGGTSFHPVYLEEVWGLYVAASTPSANDFCPPLVGYSGTSARPMMSFDVSTVASNLPSYSTLEQPRPPIAEVAARVLRFNPIAGQIGSVVDRRQLTPANITDADGYGLNYAQTLNAAGLCLISDDASGDKEDVVIGLATSGWQWYNAFKNESQSIGPDGGQNQYHPFPMILALAWNGESAATIGAVATDTPANLFGQPVRFEDSLVSAVMNPHGAAGEILPKAPNDDLPYASHRKLVSGVSGNIITMATAQEAEIGGSANSNPKISHVGMRLRRESDGLTTTVTDENASARTYSVEDSSGFTVADTVFLIPPYDPAVGDYDWSLLGAPNNGNSFGPSTSYRTLNKWSGMVMALRAIGLMHVNFDAFEGYVIRANGAGDPQSQDYTAHHSTYFRGPKEPQSPLFYNWDSAFWENHWTAISTVPSTI